MSDMRSRRRIWIVSGLALALAALACTAPAGSGAQNPTPTATTEVETAATEVITEAPSSDSATVVTSGPSPVPQGPTATPGGPPAPDAPAATVEAPPATPSTGGGTAEYEAITFFYDYSIASKWEVKTVPSEVPSDAPESWRVATHYEFTFPDYPVANKYQAARILIFPVSAWQNYNSEAEKRIPALQKLLKDKPGSFGPNESIPVLPVFPAQQVFRSHVAYLSFQNGSGVRFITQYDQAPIPINNSELFYTFQGLTSDGKYNVAVFFPITHPILPADDKDPEKVIGPDFLAYLDTTVKALNDAGDSSFSPEIGAFDRMLQSLKVK